MDPDDARRFALKTGGATILAAAMTERRGFIAKRNKTICFVRVFVETPDQMRADFRTRMGNAPDTTTDSIEVRADVWATLLGGRVVGFRAVNLPDGIWMVTISRMLADG
ncbi:MAG: hypothetical protein KJN93_00280 [Alphaproteobacteria bacterium]|nr:hypothetical protein [Alphaproteobacteria bacterium]